MDAPRLIFPCWAGLWCSRESIPYCKEACWGSQIDSGISLPFLKFVVMKLMMMFFVGWLDSWLHVSLCLIVFFIYLCVRLSYTTSLSSNSFTQRGILFDGALVFLVFKNCFIKLCWKAVFKNEFIWFDLLVLRRAPHKPLVKSLWDNLVL